MNRTDVLQRIDDGWRRLTDLVEGLDPATFTQPGTDERTDIDGGRRRQPSEL